MSTTPRAQRVTKACRGLHHRDRAELVTHDRCGAVVAKAEDGRLFAVSLSSASGAEGYVCWQRHECNPEAVTVAGKIRDERLEAGEILKGVRVVVVRGRKVAKGTEGVVFWLGVDNYGKERIGFKTDANETIWIAKANVEVVK